MKTLIQITNKHIKKGPVTINVKQLNALVPKTIVDLDLIIKNKIANPEEAKALGVKILGDGELTVALMIKLPVSKGARKKIEKAGGEILA